MSEKLFEEEGFVIFIEESNEKSCSLRLKGECNQPGFLLHSDKIIELLRKQGKESFFLDCSGLKHVNSRFIGLLIALVADEKKIGLKEPGSFLRDLLEMTGILNAFHIYTSYADFRAAEQ